MMTHIKSKDMVDRLTC